MPLSYVDKRNRETEKQLLIFSLIFLILNLFIFPFTLRYKIDNKGEQPLLVASLKSENNDQTKFLLKEINIIDRLQNQYGPEYIKLNNNNLELSMKSNSGDMDTMIKDINEIIDVDILNLLNNSTYIIIKGRVK